MKWPALATVFAHTYGATDERSLLAGAMLATGFRLIALKMGWRVPVAPRNLVDDTLKRIRR